MIGKVGGPGMVFLVGVLELASSVLDWGLFR